MLEIQVLLWDRHKYVADDHNPGMCVFSFTIYDTFQCILHVLNYQRNGNYRVDSINNGR